MLVDFATLSPAARYATLTHTVIPRPIAWTLTSNEDGSLNLAPFSYFNVVASEPAVVSISIGRKRDGQPKDTAVNILQRKNFVIHIARTDEVATLNQTAAPLARGESEVTANALKTEAVAGWPLPRLAGASVALCGKLYAAHAIGANTLILGEIRAVWLDDELGAQAEEDGSVRPTPEALQPLARLGGTLYAPLGDRIDVPRPS